MALSEQQLETWSHQGPITTSSLTYTSIKSCIEKIDWNSDISYDIYLQGSYMNSTNIRANSDVDIVAQFNSIFYSNKETFNPEQLNEFEETYPNGKYAIDDYKKPIIKALIDNYGNDNVIEGNKSLKIIGKNGRLNADIICCAEYRKYSYFSRLRPYGYVSGIIFWEEKTGKKIISFPKLHYENGTQKNEESSSNFKSAIRIFKNLRSSLIDKSKIAKDIAPSYFLECLLYNVPDIKFKQASYLNLTHKVLEFLAEISNKKDLSNFVCQSRQLYLFGTSDQQWNTTDCEIFISSLIDFYNER
jgi:hypothetical protein